MTIEELNALVEKAHAEIGSEELPLLYMRAFQRAGGVAADHFARATITASAWVAPSASELASGMTFPDREKVEKELQQMQDELTLLLLIPLGAVAAAGLAEALTRRGEEVFAERVLFDIQRIVQKGIEDGLTVSAVASELREQFVDLAPDMALTIARTQTTALVNESSLRAAKAVEPTIYKTWVTAGDARVRPAHSQAAGQTKPLNSSFQVGGASLQYPGDPSGPLDMVANCRCVLTYTKTLLLLASASSLGGGEMKDSISVRFDTSAGAERMEKDDLVRLGCFVARVACEKRWDARAAAQRIVIADAGGENVGPPWRAVLGAENSVTPDGRMIGTDALEPRYFPLPFMALFETGPGGHEGAQLAGRIDAIEKDGSNYVGSGFVDLGEAGAELLRLRQAGMPLGVSFDLAIDTFELRHKDDPFGEAIPEEEELEAFLGGEAIFVITKGTILGATAAPMQAIDEANEIEILVEDGEGMPAVVRAHAALEIESQPLNEQQIEVAAREVWTLVNTQPVSDALPSFVASGGILFPDYQSIPEVIRASASFPTFPPLAWFQRPDPSEGPKPITYSEEGQVSGWLAPWEGCHYGYSTCVPPPRSSYNYAYFMTGELKTAEGELIPVGKIMFCREGGKHVDADPRMSAREAAEHYDDSTKLGAYVAAGEDEWGIWLAGAVKPGLTDEELQHLRANLPSGDWRPVGSSSELIAAFSVPVGGFAIPRADLYLAASANGPDRMQALIIRPGMVAEEELTEGEVARAVRVLAARAHGPEALAELARS